MVGRLTTVLWCGLLAALGNASAEEATHAYFPTDAQMRLSYAARTTLDENAVLRWDVTLLRTAPLEGGARRVQFRVLASSWESGRPVGREELYVIDPRGVYTPAEDNTDAGYGPFALLPSADALARPDTVWHYIGRRPRPMALRLLGLLGRADTLAPTEGHYHVLSIGPLETAAGTFERAVQVAGVETLDVQLEPGRSMNVLLRCRRWYVAGIGLVGEDFAFLDFPAMGVTSTELTAYEGVREAPESRPVTVAERPGEEGAP